VYSGFDRSPCFTSAKINGNNSRYLVPISLEPKIIVNSFQYL